MSSNFNKRFTIPLILFALSLTIYTIATSRYKPVFPYHHNLYVAKSLLEGRFDIQNPPDYYHDFAIVDGKKYAPFGLSPAIVLIPFVATFKQNLNPQYVGAFIGALNVLLVFLGSDLEKPKGMATRVTMSLFFAFGTVHFYSVFIGSTWYFGQVVGVFFLLLAMNFILLKPATHNQQLITNALAGLALSMAVLARAPIILSLPFFIFVILRNKHATGVCACQTHSLGFKVPKSGAGTTLNKVAMLISITSGFVVPIIFQLIYNYARFESIFQDGHALVYNNYKNFPVPVTILQKYFPDFSLFNFLDIRNIPIHFYTAFLLLPKFIKEFPFLEFSPFGTSILITSPLLLLIPLGFKKIQNSQPITYNLQPISIATAMLIMFSIFLHFMQGWVQFSYRYLLDFLPFLLIPLAAAIKHTDKRIIMLFLIISIVMNTLGVIYGAR